MRIIGLAASGRRFTSPGSGEECRRDAGGIGSLSGGSASVAEGSERDPEAIPVSESDRSGSRSGVGDRG
jgi:hypothetical protein